MGNDEHSSPPAARGVDPKARLAALGLGAGAIDQLGGIGRQINPQLDRIDRAMGAASAFGAMAANRAMGPVASAATKMTLQGSALANVGIDTVDPKLKLLRRSLDGAIAVGGFDTATGKAMGPGQAVSKAMVQGSAVAALGERVARQANAPMSRVPVRPDHFEALKPGPGLFRDPLVERQAEATVGLYDLVEDLVASQELEVELLMQVREKLDEVSHHTGAPSYAKAMFFIGLLSLVAAIASVATALITRS